MIKREIASIGVWMDHAQAKLIEPGKPAFDMRVIESPVEGRVRIEGEGADGTRLGGYRSTNNEVHKHNREQNELHQYYKQLADVLLPYEKILLCGPGTARKEFHNYLLDKKRFNGKKILSMQEDKFSDNQLAAYVTNHLQETKEYFFL
jgi:hypothetical protein